MNSMSRLLSAAAICLSMAFAQPAPRAPAAIVFSRSDVLTLPDGTPVASWEQTQQFSKTYYVDQKNPKASDANPGTAERPFSTINHAAQLAKPGERVIVKAGLYREWVRPAAGGSGPDKMISYESQPAHAAVIRGSCILSKAWQRSTKAAAGTERIWTIRLPEKEFAENNPFSRDNIDERDGNMWSRSYWQYFKGKAPYTLKRGLVFQDGRRMRQVGSYEDLAVDPGTFWVDENGARLYAHPFGDADPNTVVMEATNRKTAFAPEKPGVAYIRFKGFVVEHIGNAFSYPVEAAVSPMGGDHWVIEDNIIRQVNAVGIAIGSIRMGRKTDSPAGGYVIIRGNTITDCGTSAICGNSINNSIIEDNVIRRPVFSRRGAVVRQRRHEAAGLS